MYTLRVFYNASISPSPTTLPATPASGCHPTKMSTGQVQSWWRQFYLDHPLRASKAPEALAVGDKFKVICRQCLATRLEAERARDAVEISNGSRTTFRMEEHIISDCKTIGVSSVRVLIQFCSMGGAQACAMDIISQEHRTQPSHHMSVPARVSSPYCEHNSNTTSPSTISGCIQHCSRSSRFCSTNTKCPRS